MCRDIPSSAAGFLWFRGQIQRPMRDSPIVVLHSGGGAP